MILLENEPFPPPISIEALLITVPVSHLLTYLQRFGYKPDWGQTRPSSIEKDTEKPSLEYLHINLGSPEIEDTNEPIEENEHVLLEALQNNNKTVRVLFSGQVELAHAANLITTDDLIRIRQELLTGLDY